MHIFFSLLKAVLGIELGRITDNWVVDYYLQLEMLASYFILPFFQPPYVACQQTYLICFKTQLEIFPHVVSSPTIL